jgi:hypothetical protein
VACATIGEYLDASKRVVNVWRMRSEELLAKLCGDTGVMERHSHVAEQSLRLASGALYTLR